MADDAPATVAVDQLDALVVVLDLVRTGAACTRPGRARRSGFGRAVVTQRVQQLLDSGLLEEGALAPSTGGRAPRELRFCADAGHLLVAEVGATSVEVAVTDRNGALLHRQRGDGDVTRGPDYGLGQVEAVFDAALAARPAGAPPIWGIGVSVPGPVEFATGQPVAAPIMPGWDRYPIRKRLPQRFRVPVWVDNDVNLMALGELRSGLARGEQDVLYIKIGTRIGAGLVSGGRLHRGAQGCAGDVGHVAVLDDPTIVCRCGNIGCLEALARGAALAREATAAAGSGRSRVLAELAGAGLPLDARDVSTAAQHGDPFSVELLTRSGERVGAMLATIKLPDALRDALRTDRVRQAEQRLAAANTWEDRGFVFRQPNGRPIDARRDRLDWKAILKAARIRDARLHDARHPAATLLLQQGVPARVVMEILGHSQISLTLRTYSHVLPELAHEAAERMGDALWS